MSMTLERPAPPAGLSPQQAGQPSRPSAAPPAIRLSGVSKCYGERFALRSIDLDIAAGSTTVLLGPNGAGKSTLLGAVSGLTSPTEGEVAVPGRRTSGSGARGQGMGVVTHKTMLYDRLTGRENLELHATLGGLSGERIGAVLELVGLQQAAEREVAEYSHGMRKRLALARALLQEPEVLVLDEPFSGLDPASQERLSQILDSLHSTTVLFATHDTGKAAAHGHRLLTLEEGSIVADSCQTEACGAEVATAPSPTASVSAGLTGGLVRFLRTAWLVLGKDLTVEVRARSVSSAMLVFAGLLATVLGMAFEPLAGDPRVIGGVLWVLITFSVMQGLARSFDSDFQDDALRGLVLSGADPGAIYLGKIVSNTLFLVLVSIVSLGLIGVFFGAPELLSIFPGLLALISLAGVGLTAVGGILTVISRHSKLGESLLPILFLPLVVPVLLAGIGSMPILLEAGTLDGGWLRVLIFYAIGMIVATTAFFEYLLEA